MTAEKSLKGRNILIAGATSGMGRATARAAARAGSGLLLLGRETASAMGINVKRLVMMHLVITSLMVSIIVSLSGLIGFVGLVIPHIFRLLLGPDHRLLVPSCLLGGASYLIVCDLLARVLPSSGESPLGIITALLGAPLFIVLLLRSRA